MWENKFKYAAASMIALAISGGITLAQNIPALDCEIVARTDNNHSDYLKKFRTSYLEQKSLIEMSNMVNFFDILVSDCSVIIVISLMPKDIETGDKQAWVFQKTPWRLIGSD